MYNDEDEDLMGGGYADDDIDFQAIEDDDLDIGAETGSMKFDDDDEDPDSRFK